MLFGPSKHDLIDNLVDCWNALEKAREEPLRFLRLKKAWDYVVVLEVLTYSDEVQIQVILCESVLQGEQVIKGAVARPSEIGMHSVHRTVGPYRQITAANAGLLGHANWAEELDKYGVLRSKYGPPPGRIAD